MKKWIGSIVLIVGISACASQIPLVIRTQPATQVALKDARVNDSTERLKVRWGGTIARVINESDFTYFEIVERKLSKSGRPLNTDASGGRFLAKINGFLDPAIYAEGRLITVIGNISGQETRPIGQFSYPFVILEAENFYLWAKQPEVYYEVDPYWYHDPWYPFPYRYYFRKDH